MSENFSTALMLLLVGMLTVFVILSLVVVFGNLLIKIVNKYLPEDVVAPKTVKAVPVLSAGAIEPSKLAAIVSAVDIVTGGHGKVKDVKRVK